MNWSGSVNGGTMVDGDHVTGNLVSNPGYTLAVAPGSTIYVDGSYTITFNGKTTIVGTPSERIYFISSLANPKKDSWAAILLGTMEAGSQISYVTIRHDLSGITTLFGSLTTTELLMDHIVIEDSERGFQLFGNAGTNLVINNSMISHCRYGIHVQNDTAQKYTFNDFEMKDNDFNIAYAGMTNPELVFNRWSLDNNIESMYPSCKTIVNNSLIRNSYSFDFSGTFSGSAFYRNLFANSWTQAVNFGSSTGSITECDTVGVIFSSASFSGIMGGAIDNCYISGFYKYGFDVYDTYVGGASTVLDMISGASSITNMRTTRNETFIPTNIIESGLTNSGITISWNSGSQHIKTKHRVQYGIVSGTYNMIIEPDYSWSNWDGLKSIMTSSPSIQLSNLKSGTKYYYVSESYDWATNSWITSAEGGFTTTAIVHIQRLDINNG